jgi:hypothetical protein
VPDRSRDPPFSPVRVQGAFAQPGQGRLGLQGRWEDTGLDPHRKAGSHVSELCVHK